jgi:V8-like Glu-specific endopeptidase
MRRSGTAAIAIVAVGLAMIGVTRPRGEDAEPPVVVEDPGPGWAALRSSTRGVVYLELDLEAVGGQPFDPGDLSGAVTQGEQSSVEAEESQPLGAESVIGDDGRIWLRHRTATYPNAAIGRVDLRQHGISYWCTGTLIDADTVLTAGHCVHDGFTTGGDGWSTNVRFTPGAEGNQAPFGECGARELFTLPGWYETGSEYQDLGLIQLDCTVGDTVGWFGYRAEAHLRKMPVNVRGYPGDKVWSSLWTMRDRVRVAQPQMAFYQADTYGGQSGSPVFNVRPCNGLAGPCILAVHAYGVHAGPAYGVHAGPAHAHNNHGPRLSQARVALISAAATDHG